MNFQVFQKILIFQNFFLFFVFSFFLFFFFSFFLFSFFLAFWHMIHIETCERHFSHMVAGGHYVAAWGAGSSDELPMLMPRKLRSGHRLMMLPLGVACGALSHCIWQLVVFTFVFGLMGNGKRWNAGWRGYASSISYFGLGISFFFM